MNIAVQQTVDVPEGTQPQQQDPMVLKVQEPAADSATAETHGSEDTAALDRFRKPTAARFQHPDGSGSGAWP